MVDITANSHTRVGAQASFFFWMTALMAGLIFGGFGLSYWQPMAAGTLRPLSPVVHVHGFFYFSWMILLVVQAALVNRGRVLLHRSLGLLGIGIGTGMIILGTIITLLAGRQQIANSVYGIIYIGMVAVIAFAVLLFLAVKNIRQSDAHRRYILFATISFMAAGINRFYNAFFAFDGFPFLQVFLTVDLLVIGCLIYDWRTLGKIHHATLVGTALVVVPQLLQTPLLSSETFLGFERWLVSLSYYGPVP